MKPIFLITHEFYPKRGGIATFAEEIARAAAGLGMDIAVWAQRVRGHEEKRWPFPVLRLPIHGTHNLACQAGLAKQLIAERRRLRHATVYLPEPGPMLALMSLQYFKTFRPHRLVLTFHGSEILRFHRNPILRVHTRRLIRHAHRISTLTRYAQDLLCAHFPEAADKLVLTPGALRADLAFRDTPDARHRHRERLVILTVGRLHPRKGQLITLDALQALPPRLRHKIEYWLVGSPARSAQRYEKLLRTRAAHADFPVKFLGNLSDHELAGIYDEADIFAMTSVDFRQSVEGFGLVYLEASAHGLPVVAHAIGGVPEAVRDGVTGLLVPPREPAQLTGAFEKLIGDRAFRERLGEAGKKWARHNRWEHSAHALFS